MKFAYADPPYPGLARRHYACAEVDHAELLGRLAQDFPDGWALSTSAVALPSVLALCPDGVRVAVWVRGERPTASSRPHNAWEPVIYWGGRRLTSGPDGPRRVDVLLHAARIRATDRRRVIGAKPAAFCWWLFELLGALPGDELVDMYPGSGGVGRAWARYTASAGAAFVPLDRVATAERDMSTPTSKNDALQSPRTPANKTAGHIHRAADTRLGRHNIVPLYVAETPLFTESAGPWPTG